MGALFGYGSSICVNCGPIVLRLSSAFIFYRIYYSIEELVDANGIEHRGPAVGVEGNWQAVVRQDDGEHISPGVNPEESPGTSGFSVRCWRQAHPSAREAMSPQLPAIAFVCKEKIRNGVDIDGLSDLWCLIGCHHA